MPAERLPKSKQALILAALCEGMAINSVCRMFKTGKHAVLRLIEETAEACEDWHDKHFTGLSVARLEVDEQWAYVHTHKERMTPEQKAEHPDRGDCWLWAAIDADSKAIISWRTGKRGHAIARGFASDLAKRVEGRVQITSDKLESYTPAIRYAFGNRADYAQEEKIFQTVRVEGPEFLKRRVNSLLGLKREVVAGAPDLKTATVCHMERYFLTMRQGNKRCARKTLAYSKSWDNHAATASIHIFVYNLVRRHETLKTTPAMKLGIVDRRWTLEDVVEMTERFSKAKEESDFEAAFATFVVQPTAKRTYQPKKPLTPWYLDKDSGGPTPAKEDRKAGVRYQEDFKGQIKDAGWTESEFS